MANSIEKPIYLDNHATTPVDPRVADIILHTMLTNYGNPNSVDHIFGDIAANLISQAQKEIAELISGDSEGVHFTSGSSEAIKLAITHAITNRRAKNLPLKIALSPVEHRAVLDIVEFYEQKGDISVTWLSVDGFARLDIESIASVCACGIELLCVMAANNEVGTIYPVQQITQIANEAGVLTLIDATQAAGRIPICATEWGISYLTISGHKIYGPKGIGTLITPPDFTIRQTHGRLKSIGDGTPNVPGIVGLGEACRLRRIEMTQDEPRIAGQRDLLEALLIANIPRLVVNGDRNNRLSNNLHIALPDVPNDAVIARLRNRLAISTGAACTSSVDTPSHVLKAMGLPDELQEGALRISLGKFTTEEEIERAVTYLGEAITETRRALATK